MKTEIHQQAEALPEAVQQVINMLDKNIEDTIQWGTQAEVTMLEIMQQDLLEKHGFFGLKAIEAIAYLTGRA